MNYVSLRTMVSDVEKWSRQIPGSVGAVAGVPRSGVMVASLLAIHLHIPLLNLSEIDKPWPTVRRGKARGGKEILVVDDTVASGRTMRSVKENLPIKTLFGALYIGPKTTDVDFSYRKIPFPRVFQWNVWNSVHLANSILDIDGVLCEDPTRLEPEKDDGWVAEFIENATPLHLPTVPIYALCTSRLERVRPQTEKWLRSHGIQYGQLKMSPYKSPVERRRANKNAYHKAEFYKKNPKARLFIESHPGQAAEIRRLTNRPVLCTATMEMVS